MSGVEIHQTSESSAEVLPPKGRGVTEVARAVLAVGREEDAAVDTVTSRGRVAFRVRKDPVDGTIDRLEERLLTGAVEPSDGENEGNTHPDGPEDAGEDEEAPEGPDVDPEPEEGTEDAGEDEEAPEGPDVDPEPEDAPDSPEDAPDSPEDAPDSPEDAPDSPEDADDEDGDAPDSPEDADDEDAPSLEEILAAEDEPVTAPARSASKVTWQDFLTDQSVQWSNEDSRDDLISRWEEAAGTVNN